MKVTKFVHSCLLVESGGRTALFDPGVMSTPSLDLNSISRLDHIFITHIHGDHFDEDFIKKLAEKFPAVRITSTPEVVARLEAAGIKANDRPPADATFFESPHENVQPMFPQPQNTGIHYLDKLTDPGDSHSFNETKPVLALPITAPWGSTIKALNLVLQLKPKHVLPIHDWHWSDQARQAMYEQYEGILAREGITFHQLATGVPVELAV